MAANAFPTFYFDNIATRRDSAGALIMPDANITVTDTKAGDYHKGNLRDLRSFTRWKAADVAVTKQVTYDYGVDVAADSMIIFGHNLSGKDILLESEPASGGGFTTRVASFSPTDNKIIAKQWGSVSHRKWRLSLSNLGTTEPEIGELFIGSGLAFPLYLGVGFDPTPNDPSSSKLQSVKGHPLGVTVDYIGMAWDLEFWPVSNSFVEGAAFLDFLARCDIRREPFFWAWDITNHPTQIYFVSVPENKLIKKPHDRNLRKLSIPIVGKTEDFE